MKSLLEAAVRPSNFMERMFLREAQRKLSHLPGELSRSRNGVLFLKYASPCKEIDALVLSLMGREIVASCAVFHSHFPAKSRTGKRGNKAMKLQAIQEAVQYALQFVSDEIVVMRSVDAQGRTFSSGSCRRSQLGASLAQSTAVFGNGISTRAWTWSGEAVSA